MEASIYLSIYKQPLYQKKKKKTQEDYTEMLPLKNSPSRPQEITVALKFIESEKYI